MRALRVLAAGNPPEFGQLPKLQAQTAQRFEPSTAVNNREPLFWSPLERARFEQILNEARARYVFVLYGLRFSGPTVMFYIKPADGLQLPEIMQWIKQTYALRFNVSDGRTGHIWGDRYGSWIQPDGPPKDAEAYVFAPTVCAAGRRGRRGRRRGKGKDGGVLESGASTSNSAASIEGSPCAGKTARDGSSPPGLPRRTAPLPG
jgi:hypothetical protein